MFDEILVATDETDLAESPVRYRETWRARLTKRLGSIVRELVLQTTYPRPGGPDAPDGVYVPTDNATGYALELASGHGARLHVLFTIDSRKYDTSIQSAVEPLEARGDYLLERTVDRAERAGVDVVVSTEVGVPHDLVLSYVEAHDVDLVVMNVHGRHRLHRLLFGSTTRRVLDSADVPVLVVPMVETGAEAAGT